MEDKKSEFVLASIGRVGVDEGERLESGVGRRKREGAVTLRLSSHGRRSERDSRERAYPRKSGLEVEHSRMGVCSGGGERVGEDGREGSVEKRRTRSKGNRKRESLSKRTTRGEGGRMCGWGTILVPNRYNYFLEGHRVNRISPSLAASSRIEGTQTRGE